VRAATYAVAAGARIIEKHFTLDKNYSDFRDHHLSADANDFRVLVEAVREVEMLMGSGEKKLSSCEQQLLRAVRRSAAAATDLPANHIINDGDLIWVRPGSGVAVGRAELLLGRRTVRALQKGDLISVDDVSSP
jgi:sialic acid synthase SpsE